MQVTIIPTVIGTFGTVTKGLLEGLEDLEVGGRVEDYKTIHDRVGKMIHWELKFYHTI